MAECCDITCSMVPGPPGKKTHLLRHFILKTIILSRQARDKHGESTQKEMRFLIEMEAVALGPEGIVSGLHPGSVYIDHTTTSPVLIDAVCAHPHARTPICNTHMLVC